MAHIYDRFVEDYRILDRDDRPVEDTFSHLMVWLEAPGCVLQRGDFQLPSDLRTRGVMKPGLYLTIVLEGSGEGGPREGQEKIYYADNRLLGMAIREPTLCVGEALRGAMKAVGLAFPYLSIASLGLGQDFQDLFKATDRPVVAFSQQAPPRIQAIASEILMPMIDGPSGELLLSAQATEILVRSMFAIRHNVELRNPIDLRRGRLQAAKDMMDADLRYPWSIAELARHAGSSRRSFNLHFRAAFGASANDYLRIRRLEVAREALVHQNLSVTEAADLVGYASPANFATAFRKHFGVAPSYCRN